MSRMTKGSAAESALEELLSGLNPQQRAAAAHDQRPLLIVAGAGTGKTTTLAHRVASLIAHGTDPGRILLLTFTRRSAAEMLRRVDSLLTRWRNQTAKSLSRVAGGTDLNAETVPGADTSVPAIIPIRSAQSALSTRDIWGLVCSVNMAN